MASRPRIVRAVPSGPQTRPQRGVAVVVRIHWHQGPDTEVTAVATAWTRQAVEIVWATPSGDASVDWVPAADVRRQGF